MSRRHWISRSLFGGRERARTESSIHAEDLAHARHYVLYPALLQDGNRTTLLNGGGQAFPVMLEALAGARREILFCSYILRSDSIGVAFLEVLIERARAGVRVCVMYDALGSIGALESKWTDALREVGVEILQFHPLAPWRKNWGFNQRNHQKILVVDRLVAFTGGLNVGREYAPEPQGEGWVDLHVKVEGPSVHELARVFERSWHRGGGGALMVVEDADEDHGRGRAHARAEAAAEDGSGDGSGARPRAMVQTIDNLSVRTRHRMHQAWRHAIHSAERSILIANAYFIPDILLRRAFRNAVRRGVDVRVLVPSRSDVAVVRYASRYLYGRLLRSGLRLFEYQGPMMHAKAAVIDGVWSTIGSFNLDRRSFLHNLEAGLVIIDSRFGAELGATIEDILTNAQEISLADWSARSWWERFKEWSSFRFRYYL